MTDSEIIQRLGGVNAVSKILGYKYNAVHNWTKRGISAFAKVQHRKYFMPENLNDIQPLTDADRPKQPTLHKS